MIRGWKCHDCGVENGVYLHPDRITCAICGSENVTYEETGKASTMWIVLSDEQKMTISAVLERLALASWEEQADE